MVSPPQDNEIDPSDERVCLFIWTALGHVFPHLLGPACQLSAAVKTCCVFICLHIEWWKPQRALLRLEHNEMWLVLFLAVAADFPGTELRVVSVASCSTAGRPFGVGGEGTATKEFTPSGKSRRRRKLRALRRNHVLSPWPRRSWNGSYEVPVLQQRLRGGDWDRSP